MDIKETGHEDVDWIQLAQVFMSTVINFGVRSRGDAMAQTVPEGQALRSFLTEGAGGCFVGYDHKSLCPCHGHLLAFKVQIILMLL